MKLIVFICLLPFFLHLAVGSPTPPSSNLDGGNNGTVSLDSEVNPTSPSSISDEEALENLAKTSRRSKGEWRKIRKALERLGDVVGRKDKEARGRKGKKPGKPKHSHKKNKPSHNKDRVLAKTAIEINIEAGIAPYLYQGDIEMSAEQIEQLIGEQNNNSTRTKRQSKLVSSSLWTMPVRYFFDTSVDQATKDAIRAAVAIYHAKTCITFSESSTPITNQAAIRVYKGVGCRSSIGRVSTTGPQDLSMGTNCADVNVAAHELMHALGFYHHQSRTDREFYVDIDLTLVDSDKRHNYDQCTPTTCENLGVDYDYASNMHYGPTDFASTPGTVVMEADNPIYQDTIGASLGPTFGDILALNKRYGCNSVCTSGATCSNKGYRNPTNCNQCLCKPGYNPATCSGRSTTCGATLYATSSYQPLTGSVTSTNTGSISSNSPLTTCDWHIWAPSGSVVEVKIVSLANTCTDGCDCEGGCVWSGVEFNMNWASSATGFRVCCQSELDGQPVVRSDSTLAVIRVFARFQTQNFQIEYRAVPNTPAIPTQTSLTVYTGANYAGTSKTYTVTNTCDNDLANNMNDVVSSLKVSGGCVRLYYDGDCSATSDADVPYKEYSADTASLPDFDNQASSHSSCSMPVVTLYEDTDYEGSWKLFAVSSACTYADGFDNSASSIKFTSGCVQLYSGSACTGTTKTYTADSASIVGDGLNDIVSSFKAC